jgi:hypothetical protein
VIFDGDTEVQATLEYSEPCRMKAQKSKKSKCKIVPAKEVEVIELDIPKPQPQKLAVPMIVNTKHLL